MVRISTRNMRNKLKNKRAAKRSKYLEVFKSAKYVQGKGRSVVLHGDSAPCELGLEVPKPIMLREWYNIPSFEEVDKKKVNSVPVIKAPKLQDVEKGVHGWGGHYVWSAAPLLTRTDKGLSWEPSLLTHPIVTKDADTQKYARVAISDMSTWQDGSIKITLWSPDTMTKHLRCKEASIILQNALLQKNPHASLEPFTKTVSLKKELCPIEKENERHRIRVARNLRKQKLIGRFKEEGNKLGNYVRKEERCPMPNYEGFLVNSLMLYLWGSCYNITDRAAKSTSTKSFVRMGCLLESEYWNDDGEIELNNFKLKDVDRSTGYKVNKLLSTNVGVNSPIPDDPSCPLIMWSLEWPIVNDASEHKNYTSSKKTYTYRRMMSRSSMIEERVIKMKKLSDTANRIKKYNGRDVDSYRLEFWVADEAKEKHICPYFINEKNKCSYAGGLNAPGIRTEAIRKHVDRYAARNGKKKAVTSYTNDYCNRLIHSDTIVVLLVHARESLTLSDQDVVLASTTLHPFQLDRSLAKKQRSGHRKRKDKVHHSNEIGRLSHLSFIPAVATKFMKVLSGDGGSESTKSVPITTYMRSSTNHVHTLGQLGVYIHDTLTSGEHTKTPEADYLGILANLVLVLAANRTKNSSHWSPGTLVTSALTRDIRMTDGVYESHAGSTSLLEHYKYLQHDVALSLVRAVKPRSHNRSFLYCNMQSFRQQSKSSQVTDPSMIRIPLHWSSVLNAPQALSAYGYSAKPIWPDPMLRPGDVFGYYSNNLLLPIMVTRVDTLLGSGRRYYMCSLVSDDHFEFNGIPNDFTFLPLQRLLIIYQEFKDPACSKLKEIYALLSRVARGELQNVNINSMMTHHDCQLTEMVPEVAKEISKQKKGNAKKERVQGKMKEVKKHCYRAMQNPLWIRLFHVRTETTSTTLQPAYEPKQQAGTAGKNVHPLELAAHDYVAATRKPESNKYTVVAGHSPSYDKIVRKSARLNSGLVSAGNKSLIGGMNSRRVGRRKRSSRTLGSRKYLKKKLGELCLEYDLPTIQLETLRKKVARQEGLRLQSLRERMKASQNLETGTLPSKYEHFTHKEERSECVVCTYPIDFDYEAMMLMDMDKELRIMGYETCVKEKVVKRKKPVKKQVRFQIEEADQEEEETITELVINDPVPPVLPCMPPNNLPTPVKFTATELRPLMLTPIDVPVGENQETEKLVNTVVRQKRVYPSEPSKDNPKEDMPKPGRRRKRRGGIRTREAIKQLAKLEKRQAGQESIEPRMPENPNEIESSSYDPFDNQKKEYKKPHDSTGTDTPPSADSTTKETQSLESWAMTKVKSPSPDEKDRIKETSKEKNISKKPINTKDKKKVSESEKEKETETRLVQNKTQEKCANDSNSQKQGTTVTKKDNSKPESALGKKDVKDSVKGDVPPENKIELAHKRKPVRKKKTGSSCEIIKSNFLSSEIHISNGRVLIICELSNLSDCKSVMKWSKDKTISYELLIHLKLPGTYYGLNLVWCVKIGVTEERREVRAFFDEKGIDRASGIHLMWLLRELHGVLFANYYPIGRFVLFLINSPISWNVSRGDILQCYEYPGQPLVVVGPRFSCTEKPMIGTKSGAWIEKEALDCLFMDSGDHISVDVTDLYLLEEPYPVFEPPIGSYDVLPNSWHMDCDVDDEPCRDEKGFLLQGTRIRKTPVLRKSGWYKDPWTV